MDDPRPDDDETRRDGDGLPVERGPETAERDHDAADASLEGGERDHDAADASLEGGGSDHDAADASLKGGGSDHDAPGACTETRGGEEVDVESLPERRPAGEDSVCALCAESLGADESCWRCAVCGAGHHAGCHEAFGRCAVPGCAGGRPVTAGEELLDCKEAMEELFRRRVSVTTGLVLLAGGVSLLSSAFSLGGLFGVFRTDVTMQKLLSFVFGCSVVLAVAWSIWGLVTVLFALPRLGLARRKLSEATCAKEEFPLRSGSPLPARLLKDRHRRILRIFRGLAWFPLIFTAVAFLAMQLGDSPGEGGLLYVIMMAFGLPAIVVGSPRFRDWFGRRFAVDESLAARARVLPHLAESFSDEGRPARPISDAAEKRALPAEARCPVCACDLDGEIVFCSRCGTPHHRECWDYGGDCAIFGCAAGGGRRDLVAVSRLRDRVVEVMTLGDQAFAFFGMAVLASMLGPGAFLISLFGPFARGLQGTIFEIFVLALTLAPCFWMAWLHFSWRARRARAALDEALEETGRVGKRVSRNLDGRLGTNVVVKGLIWGVKGSWLVVGVCVVPWFVLAVPTLSWRKIGPVLFIVGGAMIVVSLLALWGLGAARRHLQSRKILRNRLEASEKDHAS